MSRQGAGAHRPSRLQIEAHSPQAALHSSFLGWSSDGDPRLRDVRDDVGCLAVRPHAVDARHFRAFERSVRCLPLGGLLLASRGAAQGGQQVGSLEAVSHRCYADYGAVPDPAGADPVHVVPVRRVVVPEAEWMMIDGDGHHEVLLGVPPSHRGLPSPLLRFEAPSGASGNV